MTGGGVNVDVDVEVDAALEAAVARLLYREAACLDDRRWDDWLALYAEKAAFVVPAWASDEELTTDPDEEVHLIYLADRAEMEDRVFRIRSGASLASTPAPRTCHLVTNVAVTEARGDRIAARANWTTHSYTPDARHLRSGHYEYALGKDRGRLEILRKRIVLLDYRLEGPIDVYNV